MSTFGALRVNMNIYWLKKKPFLGDTWERGWGDCVDAITLQCARANPDSHRGDKQYRVDGWSRMGGKRAKLDAYGKV